MSNELYRSIDEKKLAASSPDKRRDPTLKASRKAKATTASDRSVSTLLEAAPSTLASAMLAPESCNLGNAGPKFTGCLILDESRILETQVTSLEGTESVGGDKVSVVIGLAFL